MGKCGFSIYGCSVFYRKPCGQNQTTCCYFGDITVTKKDRTCQGIKLCELNSELREMQHKSVDHDSDLQLKINNEVLPSQYIWLHIKQNATLKKMAYNVPEHLY